VIARFFRKIFIAIVHDGGAYDVRVVIRKQKKEIEKQSRRFEGESAYTQLCSYVLKQCELSPIYYVALLNPYPKQGALLSCTANTLEEMEELIGTQTLCREEKWLLYASRRELDALAGEYKSIGLDFIFSPFSILEHFFADKIKGGFALYALAQKDAFTIAIFDEGRLEYAYHYPIRSKSPLDEDEESIDVDFSMGIRDDEDPKREKGISLDDIESLEDLDILDELNDLSDIEDLDNLEEIVEFSEDEPTFEEKKLTGFGSDIKRDMDRFNQDYQRFELIQRTLIRFYDGERCRDRFVETVYIADGYGSGSELKRYLEEELFLNVLIRRIDIADEVIALSVLEEAKL
jgi:hypothetical protein